jgi:GNAT superfamily N-acetyltransferase
MSMPGWPMQIGPCPCEVRRAALDLLYRRVPGSVRASLIEEALREAGGGTIDLSGLWVARRRGRVFGALLTQPLAGRVVAVWAPEVRFDWRRGETAVALIRAALEDLKDRGFLLAQALVDESAPARSRSDLTHGGLPHVTDLIYLDIPTSADIAVPPDLPAFDWVPFGPETEADFHATLEATYAGSLDMPELEGLRSLDDTMAGHRAAGRFDPTRWLLGHVRGEPGATAILLLAAVPDQDVWEVAYLGLTPPARGRGFGLAALAHAVALARPHAARLQLAVDARNLPASRLYHKAGLRPFDRRAVHLVTLR